MQKLIKLILKIPCKIFFVPTVRREDLLMKKNHVVRNGGISFNPVSTATAHCLNPCLIMTPGVEEDQLERFLFIVRARLTGVDRSSAQILDGWAAWRGTKRLKRKNKQFYDK